MPRDNLVSFQAMSSSPAQPPSDQPPGARSARWLDRLAAVLLAGSLGVTVATAVPSLLVAAGVDLPAVTLSPTHPYPGPAGRAHGGSLRDSHPDRFHGDDPEGLDEPDYAPPEGSLDPDRDLEGDDAPRGQLALARKSLALREQPVITAEVVGEVKAGEQVTVPLIVGEWALVSYDGGAVMGWAKKSEIAIR